MDGLEREIDAIAGETAFAGVVRVDRGAETVLAKAYGLAHRGLGLPNAADTQFALASGANRPHGRSLIEDREHGRSPVTWPSGWRADGFLPRMLSDGGLDSGCAETASANRRYDG